MRLKLRPQVSEERYALEIPLGGAHPTLTKELRVVPDPLSLLLDPRVMCLFLDPASARGCALPNGNFLMQIDISHSNYVLPGLPESVHFLSLLSWSSMSDPDLHKQKSSRAAISVTTVNSSTI
jgi:hypothetical protein